MNVIVKDETSSSKACTLICRAATATLPFPSTWETKNGKLQVLSDIPVKLEPATWEQKNLWASKVKREEAGNLFYDETLRTGGQLARKVKRFDLTCRAWVENCSQLVKYLPAWTAQSWNCDTYICFDFGKRDLLKLWILKRISFREGCKKAKWKFKMAFAMKGGGSGGGLVCH